MKAVAILVLFTVFAYASATALPDVVYDGPTYDLVPVDDSDTDADAIDADAYEAPFRQRRVTCDLLSFQSKWLSINHSACAARCIAQRRKGGRCRDGICVCRS